MEHQATRPSGSPPAAHNPAASSPDMAEAIAKGYEPQDLALRPVFVFIAGLSVTLVVVLAVIYGIMMALAAYDRGKVATQSPVTVKLPAPYAPLQPSLGIYDNHANDHNTLDWQDMDAMRYKAQQAINSSGSIGGRSYIPISTAMSMVIDKNLLVTKPAILPATVAASEPAPAGSYEGYYNNSPTVEKFNPNLNPNDLQRLNNLGN